MSWKLDVQEAMVRIENRIAQAEEAPNTIDNRKVILEMAEARNYLKKLIK